LLIQEEDIDFVFCDAMDHTSRHDDSPTANQDPSQVLDESGVYPDQRVHSSPLLNIIPDSGGYQCCTLEEAELLAAFRSLNIVMSVQFVLILVATVLSMYEGFNPCS
jgi:hypothetical protein